MEKTTITWVITRVQITPSGAQHTILHDDVVKERFEVEPNSRTWPKLAAAYLISALTKALDPEAVVKWPPGYNGISIIPLADHRHQSPWGFHKFAAAYPKTASVDAARLWVEKQKQVAA